MEHTIFYHDNVGDFQASTLFKCGSTDIFTVVASFEKQFPTKKIVSVTMSDGTQWMKYMYVGWQTF